ncbi:preprotein translocase subunit SecE [Caulobacter flavus]|jgi:preprotein translocase subunit SecE|uniref:Protein translocase subunit SecE n=2 Tax=Caulobacter TaxID=75 RepID=A0A2N5CT10_9CAUL|nr:MULTISPECIES: preprotein translocase subunit SecE [Caulobacter]AYV49128.1 preprotein translocase subunit SecE [Caulobacter flavus]KSB91536.1 preprotein translocase subunit SecE [Caulobacter vibrioides]PLR14773.1 preprotein translocase subunit SecE [Caulobacter flavus]PVM83595.1 preprotein translocase subunit SecE [Caulobacter endophyticus]
MARKPGSSPSAIKNRAARTAAALAPAGQAPSAAAAAPKKPFNPVQFIREVRAEARKITWTTRKETWITSVMVFIMVIVASVFFFGVDWILGTLANLLLKFAAG